jgi:hypothetical protein
MADEIERMQALMANYYGVEDQKPESVNTTDIDSEHYDAEGCVQKLLKVKSYSKLLTHDESLRNEIAALDGDMRMLV